MTVAGTGYQTPFSGNNDYNALEFVVKQILSRVRGSALVQVKACTNTGNLAPIGTVDVQPLVNQLDGANNSVPHGTIPGIPYARMSGGINAIICDPAVGDIGVAVFNDRDTSIVRKTKAQANPGSGRRNDWADGVYLFTVISAAAPTQYIRFSDDGIDIEDKNGNSIIMNSDGVTINGVLFDQESNISGAGTVDADGEGTFNSHTVGAHQHAGGTIGSGETDPPTG